MPLRKRLTGRFLRMGSVKVPWLPGRLPIVGRAVAWRSLPASHSCIWPGAAVFGYGLECRKLSAISRVGAGAGRGGGPSAGAARARPRCPALLHRDRGRSAGTCRRVGLRNRARGVAEQQREVVARGLRRRTNGTSGRGPGRSGQALQGGRHARVVGELLERRDRAREARVQLGRASQRRRAHRERRRQAGRGSRRGWRRPAGSGGTAPRSRSGTAAAAGSSRMAMSSAGGPPAIASWSGSPRTLSARTCGRAPPTARPGCPPPARPRPRPARAPGTTRRTPSACEARLRSAGSRCRISGSSPAKARFSRLPAARERVP